MRLTESIRIASLTSAETRAAEGLYNATNRASTGNRINAPSDDPTGYSIVAKDDAAIARLTNRGDMVGQAADGLDLAEGALAQAGDIMSRARELATQMANGDMDAASRTDAANEVGQLYSQMIGLANTKGPKGYVFGGTANATPPFTQSGAFVGNAEPTQVEIADGVVATSNANGATAFTAAGGRDVLKDLANLQQALSTNNVAGVQSGIDAVTQSQDQLIAARSQVGVVSSRLRAASDMTTATLTTLKGARAHVAEVDPVQAYTDLATTKSTYERSIQVTAQILSLSAFNH